MHDPDVSRKGIKWTESSKGTEGQNDKWVARSVLNAMRYCDSDAKRKMFYMSDLRLSNACPNALIKLRVQDILDEIKKSFDETCFFVVNGNISGNLEVCRSFLSILSETIDPKRIIYIPGVLEKEIEEGMDALRNTVEGMHMAFLNDQVMIFKENCRYIYELSDMMEADKEALREELDGSEYMILGSPEIKGGTRAVDLYKHIDELSPSSNTVIISNIFDSSYNINWTYICADSIQAPEIGMRVFTDCGPLPRYCEVMARQNPSMALADGTVTFSADQYRAFYSQMEMPTEYRTDKNVTVITDGGYSIFLLQIRIFTSTILDGGKLLKIQHPYDYFKKNLNAYVQNSIKLFTPYYLRLKEVSTAVRAAGGDGELDRCTILIEDHLKIFVDPVDYGLILYRTITKGVLFYDNFTDAGFPQIDKKMKNDTYLRHALNLRPATTDLPEHITRRNIRRMNPIADFFISVIKHGIVRRWDDRLLDPEIPLEEIFLVKASDEEEE